MVRRRNSDGVIAEFYLALISCFGMSLDILVSLLYQDSDMIKSDLVFHGVYSVYYSYQVCCTEKVMCQ